MISLAIVFRGFVPYLDIFLYVIFLDDVYLGFLILTAESAEGICFMDCFVLFFYH